MKERESNLDHIIHEVPTPLLPKIAEHDYDEAEEGNRFINKLADGNTIELTSPNSKTIMRIRNSKIPIVSDNLRFQELQHIERTMNGMQVMPDFGYSGDNFVIDRDADAPRNWKLLTDFIYNKDKYEYLQNHLVLRKLRIQQTEEDEKKRQHFLNRKNQAKEQPKDDKKDKFKFAGKEQKQIEELKMQLHQQAGFLERFKTLNATTTRSRKSGPFHQIQPATTTNAAARRTLIERQKDHMGFKKSKASLSPD